jgi:hypothetical protein
MRGLHIIIYWDWYYATGMTVLLRQFHYSNTITLVKRHLKAVGSAGYFRYWISVM